MYNREKYIKYVVGDLIRTTIFDQYENEDYTNNYTTMGTITGIIDGLYIKFPFKTTEFEHIDGEDDGDKGWWRGDQGLPYPLRDNDYVSRPVEFGEYISDHYGVRKDEYHKVFNDFKKELMELLIGNG
jgi:hypothetical protein